MVYNRLITYWRDSLQIAYNNKAPKTLICAIEDYLARLVDEENAVKRIEVRKRAILWDKAHNIYNEDDDKR